MEQVDAGLTSYIWRLRMVCQRIFKDKEFIDRRYWTSWKRRKPEASEEEIGAARVRGLIRKWAQSLFCAPEVSDDGRAIWEAFKRWKVERFGFNARLPLFLPRRRKEVESAVQDLCRSLSPSCDTSNCPPSFLLSSRVCRARRDYDSRRTIVITRSD